MVGAHLSGQPLNTQLTERNAKLLQTTRTAAGYRLYALANTSPPKPGLVFDGNGAGAIEVEIWEMDEAAFGSFVALIPSPLGIGTITLCRRAKREGICLRGPRHARRRGHHRVRRLAGATRRALATYSLTITCRATV